jgi:hypothetical protein
MQRHLVGAWSSAVTPGRPGSAPSAIYAERIGVSVDDIR